MSNVISRFSVRIENWGNREPGEKITEVYSEQKCLAHCYDSEERYEVSNKQTSRADK